MAYKGRFKPKNPQKYKGDPTRIVTRSSWELRFCRFLDARPDILWWSSEETIVRYTSPVDLRTHRYFPDFLLCKDMGGGKTQVIMVEVKPYKETIPPDPSKEKTTSGRKSRRFINEMKTWGVNQAKWAAAEDYCAERGWLFKTFTEYELGLKKRK